MLADLFFWKLWLARRFTSPGCEPVCCDANQPLPFAREAFSLVVLADAFPYIWHKRLLAEEMMRLSVPDGVIVMPHLHSALGENFSAGNTLTPAAYRDLFASRQPRLFSDELLLTQVLEHGQVDLTRDASPAELGAEPSFTLIAGGSADLFQRYELPAAAGRDGRAEGESSLPRRAAWRLVDPDAHLPHARIRGGVRRMPAVPARHGDGGRGSDRHHPAGDAGIPRRRICDAGASSSTRRRTTAESAAAQLQSFDGRKARIDGAPRHARDHDRRIREDPRSDQILISAVGLCQRAAKRHHASTPLASL